MYRVSVSGYNLQFLRVSEPVFMSKRVFYLLGSILTVIASVLLSNLLLQSMIFAGLLACARDLVTLRNVDHYAPGSGELFKLFNLGGDL